MANISPLVKTGVSGILRQLQLVARKKEILNTFIDPATGKAFREAEAEDASVFEDATGGILRAAKKGEAGDFVATSGKW